MTTEILLSNQIERAVSLLEKGEVVAIPTETVYGLAANALHRNAIRKIFKVKGRPADNPLIVHISCFEEVEKLATFVPEIAWKAMRAFWPGPFTVILPKANCIPEEISAGLNTIAIRFPSHLLTQKLISACGFPLAAPSANLSGKPSPTKVEHVFQDLNGKIPAILDGGDCFFGLESTVVTFVDQIPKLLRPGAISISQLRDVLGEVTLDPSLFCPVDLDQNPSSPGMKYKHYAPRAKVILVKATCSKYIDYVNHHAKEGVAALCFSEYESKLLVPTISFGSVNDVNMQAHELFSALRRCDQNPEIQVVYACCPDMDGIGMAVNNRLIRAAGFEVIEVE